MTLTPNEKNTELWNKAVSLGNSPMLFLYIHGGKIKIIFFF